MTVPEILKIMHRINVETARAREEEIETRIQARDEARRKKQEKDREFVTGILKFVGIDDEAIERLRKRGEENERSRKEKLEKGGSLIMCR